ncbi:MAG: hypothetical protein ACKOX6_04965 [Bdellovibrio sp.]
MKNYLLILFASLISISANAHWITDESSLREVSAGDYLGGGADSRGAQYVIPNEIHPEEAKNIWSKAPTGVYISVGTERGFIGAAMAQNASHLLLLDLVPEIVFFNRLNTVLLKVSDSLSEYKELRQTGDAQLWIKKSASNVLNKEDRELMQSREFFEKFHALQKENSRRLLDPALFVGSSYMKSEALFTRLQQMARANRIWVAQGNLMDEEFLKSTSQRIQNERLQISCLDLSNAWDYHYTGATGVQKITQAYEKVMSLDSVLLVTNVRKMISNTMYLWNYHGFTYRSLSKIQQTIDSDSALYTLVRSKKLLPEGELYDPQDLKKVFVKEVQFMNFFSENPKLGNFFLRRLRQINKCLGISCSVMHSGDFGANRCEKVF